ncbi:hypothetical protein DTL42_20365 [Bremerella cremea]|uniref:Uncharacterized protein n=1 Tax=Bremerella cremea TaxID=1031537 RepID=A0A368KLT6_9BACT|nr:hypothetical protein [Bremerella cremea]RCS42186.1 hypothetical protein DTL42_20365 [Bremerella cremea]
MIDPQEHAKNRGLVESILQYIPGFSGYLAREYRRESDSMTRNYLAEQLQKSKKGLDEYGQTLVGLGALDQLPMLERLRSRLDMAINRLRAQMPGYSGFFDFVQVDEGVLTDLYEHDLALVQQVDALANEIQGLATTSLSPAQVVPELIAKFDGLLGKIDYRENMLKGVAAGPETN